MMERVVFEYPRGLLSILAVLFVLISMSSGDRIKMGEANAKCDNAKKGIEVDWDPKDAKPYTCPGERNLPTSTSDNKLTENLEEFYPRHDCLNTSINYKEAYGSALPTSGAHRPLWAIYGSYVYCPPQRWLHNMEHGAVVLVFHPCANPEMVSTLINIVRGCLYRHVITPSLDVPEETPFALLSWRNKLLINTINREEVVQFIKNHGLKGPEHTARNGQYKYGLIARARPVRNSPNDSKLCPKD